MNQKSPEATPEQIEKMREAHRHDVQRRYKQLPEVPHPERANTVVTMPSNDYRLDMETHKGLMSSFARFGAEVTICGHSDIGIARNKIFNAVLHMPFEWIVCIDTDIGFSDEDMERLLTLDHGRDYAVQGAYAKKNDLDQPVVQGLGFTRIHRCVLEAVATHFPFRYQDEEYGEFQDFCITGATQKMGMLREDSGFWFLCSEVGVTPRILWDLDLKHFGGRRGYMLSSVHKFNKA